MNFRKLFFTVALLIGTAYGQCGGGFIDAAAASAIALANGGLGCTILTSDVTIDPILTDTQLMDLSSVEEIQGFLDISGNQFLTNLDGLNQLKEVSGRVNIAINDVLVDIEFASLQRTGEFYIDSNPALPDLNGINSLVFVSGDFYIMGCNSLTSIVGFQSLSVVSRSFVIAANEALIVVEITAFNNGAFIGNGLYFEGNPNLQLIHGFQSNIIVSGTAYFAGNNLVCSDPCTREIIWKLKFFAPSSYDECFITANPGTGNC